MSLNIAIVYGSVRSERKGIRVAKFLEKKIIQRGNNPSLIDPMEYSLPLLDKQFFETEKPSAKLKKLHNIFLNCDAVIVVSGEYNNSIPPALTNLMDYFYDEYEWKPSGIACYSSGNYAGVRAAMQLRAFLGELGMPSVRKIFSVPKVSESISDKGELISKELEKSSEQFLEQVEWYAQAVKDYKIKKGMLQA